MTKAISFPALLLATRMELVRYDHAMGEDGYTCAGLLTRADGEYPLCYVDLEQAMTEEDPFYSLPCGPEIVAGYGVHAAESLPDGF